MLRHTLDECRQRIYSARFASISILIATVWLMPETDSAAGANIKLKSRRVIGSVVTDQRVRPVSLSGVRQFHVKRDWLRHAVHC